MAVDSKQKRFAATTMLMPGFTPGVVPEDASIDVTLRQAVSWLYPIIAVSIVQTVLLVGSITRTASLTGSLTRTASLTGVVRG